MMNTKLFRNFAVQLESFIIIRYKKMKKYLVVLVAALALMSAGKQDSAITKEILSIPPLLPRMWKAIMAPCR